MNSKITKDVVGEVWKGFYYLKSDFIFYYFSSGVGWVFWCALLLGGLDSEVGVLWWDSSSESMSFLLNAVLEHKLVSTQAEAGAVPGLLFQLLYRLFSRRRQFWS